MPTVPPVTRWLSTLLAAVLLAAIIPQPAVAAMIGTQTLAEEAELQDARARVATFLQRDDVRAQLVRLGVSPEAAEQRVEALSESEVRRLAAHMEEMPAGGIDILGAALIVFLVLLATDILGFTDIFPFVTDELELE